jgi:hypothetical protein
MDNEKRSILFAIVVVPTSILLFLGILLFLVWITSPQTHKRDCWAEWNNHGYHRHCDNSR